MNCRVVCSLMCALAVLSGVCQAAVIEIHDNTGSGQDGFMYAGSSKSAFSTIFDLIAVSKTPGAAFDAISLAQFDLSGVGVTSAEVTSAKLSVFSVSSKALHDSNVDPTLVAPVEIAVSPVTGSWARASLSYATQPTHGASAGTFEIDALGEWFEIDVTSIVTDWLDGAANHGLWLEGTTIVGHGETSNDSPFSAAGIASGFVPGGGTSANGPLLTINTVPEPASVILALTALPVLGWVGWKRRRKAAGR